MAATTQKYLNLKNITLTMKSGLVADVTLITIKRNPKFADRTPGMAWADQQVRNGEAKPEITIEGFNSDDLSFGEIIPGDAVESFVLNDEASASVLQNDFFTMWPVESWVFGAVDTSFSGEDCSKWRIPIECNVLNPLT